MTNTLSADGLEALMERLGLETPMPNFDAAETLSRPLGIFRSYLANIVTGLVECDPNLAFDAIQSTPAVNMGLGDLTIILPRLKLKAVNKAFTQELLEKFPSSPLYVCPIAEGIQIRIFSSPRTLPRLLLPYVADRGATYGFDTSIGFKSPSSPDDGRCKVLVEFSSPNIASEFTGAHLRSTINGAYVANIYERLGWEVVRLNYLGDWGKQVALLAVGWQEFGDEEEFGKDAITHLLDVYERIHKLFQPEIEASHQAREEKRDTAEIESQGIYAERDAFFRRMEDGDKEAVALWRRFRDVYTSEYAKGYARLGIRFDEYTGESQVSAESVAEVETALKTAGVYDESEGSWTIDFAKHGAKGLGFAIVRGRTGATTYLLRDIAAVLDRSKKYDFDKMIYVVASEQDAHFNRVAKALELMGRTDLASKLQHVGFGRVQGLGELGSMLADPSPKDEAKGNPAAAPHMLGDLIDRCAAAARFAMAAENDEEAPLAAAEAFGITSLIAQDMATKRSNGYAFDKKNLTDFEGDTGLSLQTSYARLSLTLKTCYPGREASPGDINYDMLQEENYVNLLRLMAQFPDVVIASYKGLEPSALLTYLFRLAEEVVACLDDDEEQEDDQVSDIDELDAARAVLYEDARMILANGMNVLGIRPVGD